MRYIKSPLSLFVLMVVSTVISLRASDAVALEQLVNSARSEGKLHIWYSTPADTKTWDALLKAFEARFKLKVDLSRTFVYSTDQAPRLMAEGRAGVLRADIAQISFDKTYLDLQKALGLFEVTDWVQLFGNVWPGIKEVMEFEPKPIRGYGLRLQDFIRVIVYNKNMLSEGDVPDTVEAFTDPKWSGKIVFGSPNLDPLRRLAIHPDWTLQKAVDVGKAMLKNKPLMARNSVAATDMVARGEGAVFLHSSFASYELRKEEGAPIAFKPFSDFVIVHGNALAPLKTAPNPNMAKLFVAWYAMEGAQISEKMENRAAVVHPGTRTKDIFDKIRKGRKLIMPVSIEDIEREAELNRALRRLVLR